MWGNDKVDSSVPQLLSGHCDLGGYHICTDLGDGTHRSVPFAGRAWRVSGTFSSSAGDGIENRMRYWI